MSIEKWLQLTLALAGLLCCAGAFYIVFFLPETSVDDSRTQERPAVERFLRKERAVENADCLWVLIAGESVKTLTSPNYPEPYPSNVHCQWLITTLQPNDTLSVKIETLLVEPEKECRLDYLQVFLGSSARAPSLGTFCGSVNNLILDTNSSTLLLVFHSDSMYEDRGFSIDYYTPTQKGCRELLTETSETLTSPGYPDNYPDETDCSTLISVQEGESIVLNFNSMDLESGENCTFDYVQIFDGKDETKSSKVADPCCLNFDAKEFEIESPSVPLINRWSLCTPEPFGPNLHTIQKAYDSTLLGQLCRLSESVTSYKSTSNHLLVHFHSDSTVNRRGYRARYTSVDERSKIVGNCQWVKGDRNGTVTSPNYPDNYPSFAHCSLWIQAPGNTDRILVSFDDLLLEMDSNCSYDFLRISEGTPSDVDRYCGRGTEPKSVLSNGNEISIEFQSDSFVEFRGFKLRYEFIKQEPENEELEEEFVDSKEDSFPFRVRPENASLSSGSSHLLHCDTDLPNARIRWLKGDVFLAGDTPLPGLKLLSNNTLWIRNMQRHLAGRYTCVAVSPEEEATATAHVKMKGGSDDNCEIEFRKTPSDSEFREGDFAHLECLAAAPEVQLSWEKDGRSLLQHQSHVTVLKNGYIFMERVRVEDAGLYTCVARDTESGCTRRVSATLKVIEETKIEEICGRPKFGEMMEEKPHAKIVGGNDAPKGAYPWQVMLWDETKRKSFCGANLLNERWILTAAHCFDKKHNIPWEKVVVKLGKHDSEIDEGQEFHTAIADSSAIINHPDYKAATHDNDLALVRLRHRVYFSDHVIPICLPDRNLSERLLQTEDRFGPRMGTVVGWGQLKEKGATPRFLQEIKLPLVDPEVCRRSTNYSVTRNMFCAGYSQEVIGDSCQGDSGGPFMMKHEGSWYLLGIVSWGEGCGQTNKYGFYTRVPNHLSWIQGIIKL